MKRSRFTPQQIAKILKECDSGTSIAELCQRYAISSSTIYVWKSRYERHSDAAEMHLVNLELENRRLRQRLDDLSLDNETLKGELRRLRNAAANL